MAENIKSNKIRKFDIVFMIGILWQMFRLYKSDFQKIEWD